MNTIDTVGGRLKALREENSLTQKDVGELVGRAQSTVREHEINKVAVKPEMIRTYADAYGVNEKWLLYGTGPKTKEEAYEDRIRVQKQKLEESSKVVSSADKDHFQSISELIALLPDMKISREKKKKYYEALASHRNELESKILFGDDEALERRARAMVDLQSSH